MSKNLELKKVNKSFVPEPISYFSDSYIFMNILWTYVHFTCSPLTLFERFERVTQGFTVIESWRPNRTLMAISVVSFSFSRAAQPGAQGPSSLRNDGFLYCNLSLTHLISSSWVSEGPLCWMVAFSTTSCLLLLFFQLIWLPIYNELYNSSIAHAIFRMACLMVIKRK